VLQASNDFIIVVEGGIEGVTEEPNGEETVVFKFEEGDTASSLFDVISIFTDRILENVEESPIEKAERKRHANKSPFKSPPVIRASCKTLLAVVPQEAFLIIATKYPSSAMHIIHVILSRFQRITFNTMARNLGLHSELMTIERNVNQLDLKIPTEWKTTIEDVLANYQRSPNKRLEFLDVPSSNLSYRAGHQSHQDLSGSGGSADTDRDPNGSTTSMTSMTDVASPLDAESNKTRRGLASKVANFMADALGCNVTLNISERTEEKQVSAHKSEGDGYDSDFSGSPTTPQLPGPALDAIRPPALEMFQSSIELMYLTKDKVLFKQGEKPAGLYMILSGMMMISRTKEERSIRNTSGIAEKKLYTLTEGELLGYMSFVTRHSSLVSVRAHTNVLLAFVPCSAVEQIFERDAGVFFMLARRIVQNVTRLVRQLDLTMDWETLPGGATLYAEGDHATHVYINLSGRLRSVVAAELSEEFGQGETIGEREILTGTVRRATVQAIRDTELARLSRAVYLNLVMKYPEVAVKVTRSMAVKIEAPSTMPSLLPFGAKDMQVGIANANLCTVCILPTHTSVPVTHVAQKLRDALTLIGTKAEVVSQETIIRSLGRHAFTPMGRLKLQNMLHEFELSNTIVIYVADSTPSAPWTQRSIKQADCILLVGVAISDSRVGEYEQVLLSTKTTARKELILLHSARICPSGTTAKWLRDRAWVNAHHHMELGTVQQTERGYIGARSSSPSLEPEMPTSPKILGLTFNFEAEEYIPQAPLQFIRRRLSRFYSPTEKKNPMNTGLRSDFARLARRLTGQSIGIVLGGGGARGIAHIGIIRAIEEVLILTISRRIINKLCRLAYQ